MSEDEAGWVRRTVLGGESNAAQWVAVYTGGACPCQYSSCGHCQRHDHAQCTTRTFNGNPPRVAETSLTDRRCHADYYLPVPDGAPRRVQLWLADRTCTWHCPCPCRDDTGRLPAGARAPLQEALFDPPTQPRPARPTRARRGTGRQAKRPQQRALFDL